MKAGNDESDAQHSQSLNVETLEHDLGRVLTVLGSVERRLSLDTKVNTCGISMSYHDVTNKHDRLTSKT